MSDCATLTTAYLQAVLHLVTSPRLRRSSAQIPAVPRRLRVLTAGTGDYRVGDILTPDQAWAHARVVAVCGASGSGRSYLAHSRVAHEARAALSQIEDGATPAQVRLPVLLTCSAWVAAGADGDGLVEAASAPLHDLGWDSDSVRRIRGILTDPQVRLLVVADGLDEASAAERDGPVQHRLHRAARRPDCDLLLTGTWAAWQQVRRGVPGARVVRPEPLTQGEIEQVLAAALPDDAEFRHGSAVIESHRGTFASNVLLLGGLCDRLQAGSPPPDSVAQLRHEMLQASPCADVAVDRGHRPHRLIQDWRLAQQLTAEDPADAAAVLAEHLWFDPDWDEVTALAVAEHPDRERILTQLVPPDLRDRLMGDAAGQAAALEADRFLLRLCEVSGPEDWSTSVREQVDAARIRSAHTHPDLVAAGAHWTTSNTQVVHALTAQDAPSVAALRLAGTLASPSQRPAVLQQVMAALAQAPADRTADLAHLAMELGGEQHDREKLRAAALAAVPQVAPQVGRSLTALILRLATTETDRASLRTAALRLLGRSNPWSASVLVELVQTCGATAEDQQEMVRVLLASLAQANPWATHALATEIAGLVTSAQEREQALQAASDLLAGGNQRVIQGAGEILVEFGRGRPEVLEAAVAALPGAGGPALAELALLIRDLVADCGDRGVVVQQVVACLPRIQPRAMASWCDLVRDLARTEAERAQVAAALPDALQEARADGLAPLARLALEFDAMRPQAVTGVLLDALAAADSAAVAELAGLLAEVSTDPTVRTTARAAVREALAGARPRVVAQLAPLTDMDGDASDREQALAAVLDALLGADPRVIDDLVSHVHALAQTPEQQQQALTAVLAAIPAVGAHVVGPVVRLAGDLAQTGQQRTQALEAALGILPQAGPRAAEALAQLVLELADEPEHHAAALDAVLAALPRSGPGVVDALTALVEHVATTPDLHERALTGVLAAIRRALPEVVGPVAQLVANLVRTPQDRDTALGQVIAGLPRTRPHIVAELGPLAVEFAHTEQQRRRARQGVLQVIQIHPFLAPVLRRLSDASEWGAWLGDRAAVGG